MRWLKSCTDLTGTAPTPLTIPYSNDASPGIGTLQGSDSAVLTTTTAGLSHELAIRTRYYNADVPIWLDEVTSPASWKGDFMSEDAGEVVKAIGAWIVVFRRGGTTATSDTSEAGTGVGPLELLAAVSEVIQHTHGGEGTWDGVCLAVGMPTSTVGIRESGVAQHERSFEEWEDLCLERGFEYIAGDDRTKVRSSEGDLRGIARIKEALEANDWNGTGDDDDLGDEFDLDAIEKGTWMEEEGRGFGVERREIEREFADLTADPEAAGDEDEATQVEELERMMLRMQATRGKLCTAYVHNVSLLTLIRHECTFTIARTAETRCQGC